MRTQTEVKSLIRDPCSQLGKDPEELIHIRPVDGGRANALSYEVIRKDGKLCVAKA
ncbi:MAG TPA: hypothetical protein VNN77_05400 [candidate division Zixibacteria bacterium]|nr:hypothetical protein [candidate division Zixibacteria bacterium]